MVVARFALRNERAICRVGEPPAPVLASNPISPHFAESSAGNRHLIKEWRSDEWGGWGRFRPSVPSNEYEGETHD